MSGWRVLEDDGLSDVVFSGLSALVIEDVGDEGELIRVAARTRDGPVACPVCGVMTALVHGWCGRTVADVPVDGRRVVVEVQVRRLRCSQWGCPRRTFREQVPGLLEKYQRRTSRLARQLGALVRELAGRAAACLSDALAVPVSYSVALRLLMRLPQPVVAVPRVLGVDDFALKRRHRYATVLPGRGADRLEAWLREHPGVEIVCRDGSLSYAEAIRRALPDAIQVADRWHLWRNLCDKVLAEVRSHSACWATVNPPRPGGFHEQTTRERWQHGLTWSQVVMAANAPMLYRTALLEGRPDIGVMATGQVVGLIDDLPTCAELITRIATEAEDVLTRLERGRSN